MITGACSDFADKRDSQCLEQIVELTEENLNENGIELEELLADGGYSSGEALAYLHEKLKPATTLRMPLKPLLAILCVGGSLFFLFL